ncbi:hypothetical protein [Corynebacterium timonense]|uniref:Uncharacterized protein n=1 Tax=Corynebacterium timonense TaxID=441500 RepID=A0A1H1T086_9CORY|nr:hypothetical protein [Corynebacterium timonense]SDS53642.1 hypothetical protein SAMN04488539_1869 [Corynebacterium timonense]
MGAVEIILIIAVLIIPIAIIAFLVIFASKVLEALEAIIDRGKKQSHSIEE